MRHLRAWGALEFLRDGECVPVEKLRELILDHIAWEEGECGGPEGVLDGLVKAYTALVVDSEENDEEVEPDLVDGAEAERIMAQFYVRGFRAAYDQPIPKENNDRIREGWLWPEALTYTGRCVFPRDLCEQIGYVKGHMSGRQSVAMRKYAEDEFRKDGTNG
jgi:hypothetical protein